MNEITIIVREEALPDDATVLVHLGDSDDRAIGIKVKNAVKHHDRWIGVLDSVGRIAVSAYAVLDIDEPSILARMPHKRYGRSTVGRVRGAGFELLPTTIDPLIGVEIRELQPFHYSIIVGRGVAARLLADSDSAAAMARRIEPSVRRLMRLFEPSLDNLNRRSD